MFGNQTKDDCPSDYAWAFDSVGSTCIFCPVPQVPPNEKYVTGPSLARNMVGNGGCDDDSTAVTTVWQPADNNSDWSCVAGGASSPKKIVVLAGQILQDIVVDETSGIFVTHKPVTLSLSISTGNLIVARPVSLSFYASTNTSDSQWQQTLLHEQQTTNINTSSWSGSTIVAVAPPGTKMIRLSLRGPCSFDDVVLSLPKANYVYAAHSDVHNLQQSDGSATKPFYNIEDARNQAADGGVVFLIPGRYTQKTAQRFVFTDNDASVFIKALSGNPAYTLLDARTRGRFAKYENISTRSFVVEGVSIFGGSVDIGGAALIKNATAVFSQVVFGPPVGATTAGNYASVDGGAMHASGSSILHMYQVTLRSCRAARRGGAVYFEDSHALWNGGSFETNRAIEGSAVYLKSCTRSATSVSSSTGALLM